MKSEIFEAVFSLGSDCVPAYQIRRFLGRQNISPFNWTAVPILSIPKIFSSNGACFAEKMMICHEGTSVVCLEYGLLYHHEFERAEDDSVKIDIRSIEKCRSRFKFMYRCFMEKAQTSRCLFVRWGGATNAPGDEAANRTTTNADIIDLSNTLSRTLGHNSFQLAFIEIVGKPGNDVCIDGPLPEHIAHHRMPFRGDGDMGADPEWDDLFRGYGLERQS